MALPADLPRMKLTAEDLAALIEAGRFDSDDPARRHVELIDGELIVVTPQGPIHSGLSQLITNRLRAAYPHFEVRTGLPLALGQHGEPEPDVSVTRGPIRLDAKPTAADTVLVVEIALNSHKVDYAKVAQYAAAGIPVYILIDARARSVTVYADPAPSVPCYCLETAIQRVPGANATIELPETTHGLSLDFLDQIPAPV